MLEDMSIHQKNLYAGKVTVPNRLLYFRTHLLESWIGNGLAFWHASSSSAHSSIRWFGNLVLRYNPASFTVRPTTSRATTLRHLSLLCLRQHFATNPGVTSRHEPPSGGSWTISHGTSMTRP